MQWLHLIMDPWRASLNRDICHLRIWYKKHLVGRFDSSRSSVSSCMWLSWGPHIALEPHSVWLCSFRSHRRGGASELAADAARCRRVRRRGALCQRFSGTPAFAAAAFRRGGAAAAARERARLQVCVDHNHTTISCND